MRIHDTAIEVLERNDILNPAVQGWIREMDPVKLGALLKTAEEMEFSEAYLVKILETCYFGRFPGEGHKNDSTIILNHLKWFSEQARLCYVENIAEFTCK